MKKLKEFEDLSSNFPDEDEDVSQPGGPGQPDPPPKPPKE